MTVSAILADPQYPELKAEILRHTGLSFYMDKDEDLASRIGRRVTARKARNCLEYLKLLGEAHEMDALIGELTIGETYFFRQREHFDVLRDMIFPELLERNQATRRLRIWSAGCATGAEPYSIDMLLELELAERVRDWDISILATDVNLEFLAQAREARFAAWAFRETPEWIQLRCFERHGCSWRLRPEFRRRVSFQRHNLAGDEPASLLPFDLVLCRNVMIYFAPDLVRRTVAEFYKALMPGGWLLVGHAEPNMSTFEHFDRVCAHNVTLYRKPAHEKNSSSHASPEWNTFPDKPVPFWEVRAKPHAPQDAGVIVQPAAEPSCAPAGTPSIEEVRLLADRGDWAKAAMLGRRLAEAEPLLPSAHFTLGLILEHTDSCKEAQVLLRRAIYLDRNFALAHYHLGACLQKDHQPDQARKAFRNVLQLLDGRPDEETVEHGDGMTVTELKELTRMHFELLGAK